MINIKSIRMEYPLIPHCEIENLCNKCSKEELLLELDFCNWCIERGKDIEYTMQVQNLINKHCLKNGNAND